MNKLVEKKVKNIQCAVNVFFNRKCYQVALTKKQQQDVIFLITLQHNGKIKVLDEVLPLKLK